MRQLAFLLLFTPLALAKIGGRCHGSWNTDNCICHDVTECQKYYGTPEPGGPGNWPCPDDPANVQACFVRGCDSRGPSAFSYCAFQCNEAMGFRKINGKLLERILSSSCGRKIDKELIDPTCPGGNDFFCCSQL